MPSSRSAVLSILATLLFAAFATAQGVELKTDAKVFYGSASATSQPASIDYDEVKKETPEWKTIQKDGVRPDSARYAILIAAMDKRLKTACEQVAKNEGRDFVCDEDGIENDNGLSVKDISKAVIKAL
jgi:hypothetical protein